MLTARDRTQDADVGGEPLAASLEQAECGRLMFYTWGGATAHIDRILVG